MIILDRASYAEKLHGRRRTILFEANIAIPTDRRIALLGPSIEEKRSVMHLLCGDSLATSGSIYRQVNTSFLAGQLPGLDHKQSLRLYTGHVARLYGFDSDAVVQFVEEVMDLGKTFDLPHDRLPSDARKLFSFVLPLSLQFDFYFFFDDSFLARKDLRSRCEVLYNLRSRAAGTLVPTANAKLAKSHFDLALVLFNGVLTIFDDVDKALDLVKRLPAPARTLPTE